MLIALKSMQNMLVTFHHKDIETVNIILRGDFSELFSSTDQLFTDYEEEILIITTQYNEIEPSLERLLNKNVKILILSPYEIQLNGLNKIKIKPFEMELKLVLRSVSYSVSFCILEDNTSENQEKDIRNIDGKIYELIQNIILNKSKKSEIIVYFKTPKNISLLRDTLDYLGYKIKICKASDIKWINEEIIHIIDVPNLEDFRKLDSIILADNIKYVFYVLYNKDREGTPEVDDYNNLANNINKRKYRNIKKILFKTSINDLIVI